MQTILSLNQISHLLQFKVSSNARMSLHNFCSWQKTLNEQGHAHHDVAVLVTRKSICETSENNCGILGELIVSYSILP